MQYDIPFMQNLQRNDTMNLFTKQKQTHRLTENELMFGRGIEVEDGGRDS